MLDEKFKSRMSILLGDEYAPLVQKSGQETVEQGQKQGADLEAVLVRIGT